MAKHANTTNAPAGPTIELTTPRKETEDALYELGVITDIISKLATRRSAAVSRSAGRASCSSPACWMSGTS